jgi:6-phosphogluconolactonase
MKITRRSLLVLTLLFSSALAPLAAKDSPKKYLLYVGTYTEKDSKGIYAFRFDATSGDLTPAGLAAETINPSFLAVDPNHRFLYAVNEVPKYQGAVSGAVSAFAIDPLSGKLTLLNEVPSRGADPCYVSLDQTGKYVLVANYTGGSAAVFPVSQDGRLGESSAFLQFVGSSANHERQAGSHAHWIETTADNRFVIIADLGADQLHVYRFDPVHGALGENDPGFAALDRGAGPRHVAFHPTGKAVYVVNELNSTVTSFSYDARYGALSPLHTVSTLPANFSGKNSTAEIHVHPNGKFLYVSNRGDDSITVFSLDLANGTLATVDRVSTQGKTPRNFEIDPTGTRLFVANQATGNIVVFRIDTKTGKLTPTGQVLQVPAPVSLKFVPAD